MSPVGLPICVKADGTAQNFPGCLQRQIGSCLRTPFDERQAAVFDFDACDTGGMDTASGIAVGRLFCANHRMMGVAGDKKVSVFLCPFYKVLFGFLFSAVIFCRAGGIGNPELFKRSPYIAHEKT